MEYTFVNVDYNHFNKKLSTDIQAKTSEISVMASQLKSGLIEVGVDRELMEICISPYHCLQLDDQPTYSAHVYVFELFLALLNTINIQGDVSKVIQHVHVQLFKYNFNDPAYIAYYTRSLQREATLSDSFNDCLEVYYEHQKRVLQYGERPGFIHNDKLATTRAQVLEWLDAEIHFIQLRKNLRLDAGGVSDTAKQLKLVLDVSVAQLAYFLRLLVESQLIQNNNISALMRHFAQGVATKRSEHISPESFKLKYYNNESGTKDGVKRILQKILQNIK
jgi:hypothetical protein